MNITGETVYLLTRQKIGTDPLGEPIYSDETEVAVDNVLIAPIKPEDIINTQSLYGAKVVYQLAIPKGDTHVWENATVKFYGETWRVFGIPIQGNENLIPLSWNKKVQVERYE